MDVLLLWLQLALGGAVIVAAGVKLTRYADVFSEKLGLGHAFVGMVFLGWVTSLPEMVMSVAAVLLPADDSVNLAFGNIMGSCYFNVFMLALMVLVLRKGPLAGKVGPGSLLPALFAMMMMLITVMGLHFTKSGLGATPIVRDPLGISVSLFSFIILAIYAYSTWMLYRQDRRIESAVEEEEKQYADWSLGATALKAALGMAVIVACGIWVACVADKIGDRCGLSKSFMGTLFLAIISSLPELTTTIAAGRMGRFEMAVGNIFGSNIFNIMVLGLADVFYRKAPLFAADRLDYAKHEIMGAMGVFLSLVFVAGILYKSKRSPLKASWTAIIVAILYVIGLVVYYFI
jgi:cation:H+ antiporter